MPFVPVSNPQKAALACKADIMLFGGAAGATKTRTLLTDAAQDIDNPNHNAILFRRTFPEVQESLEKQSYEAYAELGGIYNITKRRWTFPSGAQISFGHCQQDSEIFSYMGAEYSYIGFDESTHFSEFVVRYMISRLRSIDPTLKLKLRLASNPGSQGNVWHMKIFQGDTCIHCQATPQSRIAFTVYEDAVWPSDGEPIGMTTCFIPGRVDDHELFGKGGYRYADKLKTLPSNYRKALLEGCWALFEGQFFRCWDSKRMVVDPSSIDNKPWWPKWISVDWGYAHATAAYLATKSPEGITYVIDEFITHRTKPDDLAKQLKERWFNTGFNGQEYEMVAAYLSPDAFAKRQDESSIASQMAEASDIDFTPASNDRIGGAMLLYSMLENGTLKISNKCPILITAIPSRIHDDGNEGKRLEDIKKTNDDLDDAIDSLKYLCYSHQQVAEKPRSLLMQEAITSKDPTIAMMQRRIISARFEKEDEPVTYGRTYRRSGGSC